MIIARRVRLLGGALLVLLMALILLPFASMFTTALHQSGTYPNGLDWPSQPQWGNFGTAFQAADMGAILSSSVLIVIAVVPVSVVIATMAGFALGQLRIRGGQLVFLLFLLGLTLPFEGVIVPIYYEIRSMGLLNTRWAIILPLTGLYMPFGIFWMRAHFLTVPRELSEAARVDGATEWQVFRKITLPLLSPTIAVVSTTMIITGLKAFDLVYTLTANGSYDTQVIANEMYNQYFEFGQIGRGSALAVVLLLAIVPVMLFNIRRFQFQEGIR